MSGRGGKVVSRQTNREVPTVGLTHEQLDALEKVMAGQHTLIEAGAGTGKTFTLTTIAQAKQKVGERGQYTAFNKKIVAEATKKMPDNCPANTMHSITFRATDRRLTDRIPRGNRTDGPVKGRLSPQERTRVVGVHAPFTIRYDRETKVLQPTRLSGLVFRAIDNFCKSADQQIEEDHFPYIDGIDEPELDPQTGLHKRGMGNNGELRRRLLPYARTLWPKLIDPDGTLPFADAYYLKLAQLNGIRIPVDFILFDEAQDVSPVMEAIVRHQAEFGTQLVFVGDSQQSINGFTGAINAMSTLPTDHRTFLTGSFRFGPGIANVANLILGKLDADLRLRGLPTLNSVVGAVPNPRAVLTRTNAVAVERVLREQENDRKVHLVGGGGELVSFCRGALDLMNPQKRWTGHPDLQCFTSWGEVCEYTSQDEEGTDLKLNVDLINRFGAVQIINALDRRMPQERYADLVVSTAHKSKGCEWDTVELGHDFPSGVDKNGDPAPLDAEAWRLLYVAVTRAKHAVDVGSVQPINDLMEEAQLATAEYEEPGQMALV